MIYVRIPRRVKNLIQYKWAKHEVGTGIVYEWKRYECYWVPETHRWNKYNLILDPNPAPGSYIEEVTDTYEYAYPSYGPDDSYSYFYEYIGYYEAYPEKGSYKDIIQGSSLGDYPSNGIQIGENGIFYYYELIGHIEENYAGIFIEYVYSLQPDTYPDNGEFIDGYWYIKQQEQ